MKRVLVAIAVLVMLAGAGAAAWLVVRPAGESKVPATVAVARGSVEEAVLASGTIEASSLVSVGAGWLTLAQWVVLAAAFVTDATVTLVRRLLLGERIFEAHRRHAYQVLSRRWGSHRRVTVTFIAINVIWLLPLAYVASLAGWMWPALALAYVPLIGIALYSGAGAPEDARAGA